MKANSERKITILDGMILVAATAAGLAVARLDLDYYGRSPLTAWVWAVGPASCLFAAWSVALLGLRLRQPRPRLIQLARQPGFVACVVTVVAMGVGSAWALLKLRSLDVSWMPFHLYWTDAVFWVRQAVAGAWLALIIGRLWRPKPSWIDRSGRLVGAYWVVCFVLGHLS
jgi:hypothetical protein